MKKKVFTFICALMATVAASAQTTGTAKATIDGKEVEIGWVQLWKDGPRFATRNVGATGTTDKESTVGTKMTFTDAAKTGSDYVWGANWKTPSKGEMDLLNTSKVTYSYVQQDGVWGFKFTGKGDYTSNSIFLPAEDGYEGYCDDCYWTSSESGSDYAWFLGLDYDEDDEDDVCDWYIYYKTNLYKVRPVLADAPAATEVTLSEDDEELPEEYEWDKTKTYDITLNRNFKANQWNTLMLSFPMTAAEVKSNFGNDVTLMKMTGIENDVVNFETVDLTTDANTAVDVCEAYIVKPTSAIEQIKVTGKTGLLDEIKDDEHDFWQNWQCPYGERYFDSWVVSSMFGWYYEAGTKYPTYVLSNDKFYTVVGEPVEVKGYRWVIYDENEVSADAKQGLSLSFDGEIVGDVATAISNVNANVDANNNGKFLQNGQLVIVKDGKTYNAAGQLMK